MNNKLILIADDNREICEFLQDAVLEPAGYSVKVVGDGMSALTLARELEPVLVLTDHQMPNLTGVELARRIHRDHPGIPVIMITGESTEALIIEALRAGVVDYFIKPFDPVELLKAVNRETELAIAREQGIPLDGESRSLNLRVQELETLAMIGRTVTAMLDLDQVLGSVLDAAIKLTEAEEGSLLLLDEESGELYMRASKNFDQEFAQTFRLRVQDSLAGQVLESGKPVFLDETAPQKIKTAYLVHSLVYVPLRARGHIIGVLGVDNRQAGRTFTGEHLMVLNAIADYAAIAIENAKLFQTSERERHKLESILTEIRNGVLVVDQENRVILINPTARETLKIEGNPVGERVFDLIENEQIAGLLRMGGSQPRREEIETVEGRVFHALCTRVEGVGQVIVMQDITHLKELDRIKSEFVTTVSHDLRSPLTAILGYVELIERAGEVNDQQREFIRRVQTSVEQITNLVTDLLDLGRIEAGLDTTKERTPIAILSKQSVEGLRGLAEKKDLILEIVMPDESPYIYGDPVRIRQMMGNLLENAIKYTTEGGTIRLEIAAEEDQVFIRVRDNGPGIPAADLPYLFDKFFRASNIPDTLPGTGLGLSIVKSIVEGHNGRIWVDSHLGEGTEFIVVLPLDRIQAN
ncbi:MAG: response regulator [Anaerolineales bacterium]|nr:response regulator [Anaerolineales bacterium]